jgi:type II secretory pathway component GspD/PulD (secretin)
MILTRLASARKRAARAALLGAAALALAGAPALAGDTRFDATSFREFDIGDGRVTFDVSDAPFGEVVAQRIQPRTRVNLIVAPEAAEERVTLRVVDLHWIQALNALTERINGALVREGTNLLRIERPIPVTIEVENEELSKVIQLIAAHGNANVVTSPLVRGTVTVSFKNAPWRAALRHVVQTVGKYSLVEEDYGILRVVPTSELELMADQYQFRYLRPPPPYKGVIKTGAGGAAGSGSVTSTAGGDAAGGSASVGADIVQSNPWIPSDDPAKQEENFPIVAALKSIVAPEGGDVTYVPNVNAVLFTGTTPKVARVRALCEQLDVEPPQIFIDMNFITTTNTSALDMGLQSDTGISVGFSGAGVLHRLPFAAGGQNGGWTDAITGSLFPPPSSASFTYGTLDFNRTEMMFQFLKKDGCSKVVQAPKILALDNQEATIFVGESIRYARSTAASNQNGGLTFSVEEDENSPVNVGFQLLVLPHVVPGEDKIMMTVIPQQRALNGTTSPIPGFDRFTVSGQTIDLPRVASSTLVTHMMLRSGETAVIGGLLEDRELEGQDKIPVLGDLPVLGLLFRGVSTTKVKQNLIITITPRILRGSDAASAVVGDELRGRCEANAAEWARMSTAPCAPSPLAPLPVAPAPAPPPPPPPPPFPNPEPSAEPMPVAPR